jgi:hypothetical protein
MCRIRPRITRHGGETFDAPAEWARWHTGEEQEKRKQDEAVLIKPQSTKKPEKLGRIPI